MDRTLAALPGSPSRCAVDKMAPAFGNTAQHVLEEARAHLFTSRLVWSDRARRLPATQRTAAPERPRSAVLLCKVPSHAGHPRSPAGPLAVVFFIGHYVLNVKCFV